MPRSLFLLLIVFTFFGCKPKTKVAADSFQSVNMLLSDIAYQNSEEELQENESIVDSIVPLQEVFSFQGDSLRIQSEFIEPIVPLERDNLTPYEHRKTVEVFTSDWTLYSVNLLRYKGFEVGDMDVIRVRNASDSLLELKAGYEPWWIEQFKRFPGDSYFLEIPLQEQVTALLFLGYPYASDPQQVTVILLHHNQATLVFNKHYYVEKIVNTPDNFSIELTDGFYEGVGARYDYNTYSLFSEDGVLKFRQTKQGDRTIDLPVQVYSMQDGNISNNEQFIDKQDTSVDSLPYVLNHSIPVSVSTSTYTIKTGRFLNWENEPGDFDVIEIAKEGQQPFIYKAYDGMANINNSENLYASSFSTYSSNGYFIEVPMTVNSKALLFFGQHYGTDLARLIVFILTDSDVKLVFNKQVAVTAITTSDTFSITLEDGIDEGEGQNRCNTYSLFSEGGVLKFKQTKQRDRTIERPQ